MADATFPALFSNLIDDIQIEWGVGGGWFYRNGGGFMGNCCISIELNYSVAAGLSWND